MFTRCEALTQSLLIVMALGVVATSAGGADPAPTVPPASSLQTGDFLWPKLPDKVVPYNSAPGEATDADRKSWEAERKTELARLEKLDHPSDEEKTRYSKLSNPTYTYQAFLTEYLTGKPAGTVMPYGAIGPVATGHVAIVDVRNGTPWVVEAMLHKGVQELTYAAWLSGRPGEKVWHARLKNATTEQRKSLVEFARSELGKRYDFWNFNLLDESGFYCSKLAWFAVWKATGQALDGESNPRRSLWFSPKQMLRARMLNVIFSPGPY